MFHYHNVSQETDIEWLSDPESLENMQFNANGSRPLLYTNQGPNGNEDAVRWEDVGYVLVWRLADPVRFQSSRLLSPDEHRQMLLPPSMSTG